MAREIFISHASGDAELASRVVDALEAAGLSCWIAPRDVRAGTEWPAQIVEAIDASRALVLVFSERADASTQVKREIERAAGLRRPIVVFQSDATVPSGSFAFFLNLPHRLDASKGPLSPHLARLVDDLRRLVGGAMSDDIPDDRRPDRRRSARRLATPLAIASLALALVAGGAAWAWRNRTGGAPDPPPAAARPVRLAGLLGLLYEKAPASAPAGSPPAMQVAIGARRGEGRPFVAVRDGDELAS